MKYNMKKTFSYVIIAVAMIMMAGLVSCVKQEFDAPPASDIPVGDVLTLAELRQIYVDSSEFTFNGDYSVYATVTMDESTGNIYRTAFIQDATDATYLFLNSSGGITEGDSIRLYLNGCTLSEYGGVFQVKDVDSDSSIVIIANEKYLQPEEISLAQLVTGTYESKLVKIADVQFANSELGKTWAEASDYGNRTIEDENENTAVVRTSSYASFAEEILPEGSGSMVGIASRYNETTQFYVRSLSEVELTGDRFGSGGGGGTVEPVDELFEDFETLGDYDVVALDGWLNVAEIGSRTYIAREFDSNIYAQSTAHNSGEENIMWMVTPPINLQGQTFNFRTKDGHDNGATLEVMISTDFDGSGNPWNATWTDLNPTLAGGTTGGYAATWTESGDLTLPDSGVGYIMFRYTGFAPDHTTIFQIDDVNISL